MRECKQRGQCAGNWTQERSCKVLLYCKIQRHLPVQVVQAGEEWPNRQDNLLHKRRIASRTKQRIE